MSIVPFFPRRPSRPRGPFSTTRVRTVAGAVGAAAALVLSTAAPASAARPPEPGVPVPPGDAYMGAGIRYHQEQQSSASPPGDALAGVQGIDVSHWQGAINWNAVRDAGIDFAWIKATEGTGFRDSRFDANYTAAYNAGLIRGAYHFARPNASGGAAQARFFANNGGAWSRDNQTLPGVLDIESNPSGGMCYGLSTTQMRNWINDFHAAYKAETSREVVIYTSPSWWNTCTGNWSGMGAKSPLWVAHWTDAGSPTIPNGFPTWTVWQYTSTGSVSGISGNVDRNRFNGSRERLLALANNTPLAHDTP